MTRNRLASGLCGLALLIAGPAAAQSTEPVEPAFRKQVTAVLPSAVLLSQPDGTRRRLAVGETYKDGWRLETLNPGGATLRKGAEQRDVDLGVWPGGEGEVAVAGEPVLVTNARLGGSPRQAFTAPTAEMMAAMRASMTPEMMAQASAQAQAFLSSGQLPPEIMQLMQQSGLSQADLAAMAAGFAGGDQRIRIQGDALSVVVRP